MEAEKIKNTAKTANAVVPEPAVMPELTDEKVLEFLKKDGNFERIVLSDSEICNAVISVYLDELYGSEGVPVVRGYSALSVLPKPKNLSDAKKIIDGLF